MQFPDWDAVLRLLALYAHVLACFAAAAGIVLGDLAVFMRRRIDHEQLREGTVWVSRALLALWITGLVIIGIDTGFAPAVIVSKGKLLAKLAVVVVLTLNGFALHRWALPRLLAPAGDADYARQAAKVPSLLGAVSACSWLFAAFLGLAKVLATVMGVGGFLELYGLGLVLAMAVAWVWARPRLARQLREPSPASAAMALDALHSESRLEGLWGT